jgi:3-demethoxyubiquinol 3-hydroxylase
MRGNMAEQRKNLPGDISRDEQVRRMIRVNHAGEYGAQRIYAGQLAVLRKSASGPLLEHMAQQEEKHLEKFSEMMVERRVRPTALMPLWHVAGYALGAATALMGEKAAMACTVAVESVIDAHYAGQEAMLDESEAELKSVVSEFRADEREHHDTALAQGAESTPLYHILTTAIVYQTRLAIWLSTRV